MYRLLLSFLLLLALSISASAQPDITLISQIQGPDSLSPMIGQRVTIEGIVTAAFFDDGENCKRLGGFFVQEEVDDYDESDATSEGIFVFAPGADSVQPGEVLRITGEVTEYETSSGASSLTELYRISEITDVDSVNLPEPPMLSALGLRSDSLEHLEGMLMLLNVSVVVENREIERFGTIRAGIVGPTPTDRRMPGLDAHDLARLLVRRAIAVDDGSTELYPTFGFRGCDQVISRNDAYRRNMAIGRQRVVIDERFGEYRAQIVDFDTALVTPSLNSAESVEPIGSDSAGIPVTRIATFNLGNFFLTLDDGSDNCGPNQNLGCRGARTRKEFDRQLPKVLAAIRGLDAHILGVVEIENTLDVDPLAQIVDSLNRGAIPMTYDYIRTGTIGTDAIRVGILYRSDIVEPATPFAVLDASVDPAFIGVNRPSLAQTFSRRDYNGVVTVVVNHFKSKGSNCERYGDTAKADGQGNCNGVRTAAAGALKQWVATNPTGTEDPDVLLLGDFNAYTMEDPIRVFTHGENGRDRDEDDYRLAASWDTSRFGSYTYVFDGLYGALDHILLSPSLRPQISGSVVWHINADEPTILDYRTDPKPAEQQALWRPDPFRSSDHDPVIVGVRLTESTVGVEVEGEMPEVMDLADKE